MKSFIKFVGGKQQLWPEIQKRLPKEITVYVEPFLGGGSVLLNLLSLPEDDPQRPKLVLVYDNNPDLIDCWRSIKSKEALPYLINELNRLKTNYLNKESEEDRKDYFYTCRDKFNDLRTSRNADMSFAIPLIKDYKIAIKTAYFIFINKTCFNGLFRVSKSNKFNTPHGKYKNPSIFEPNHLRRIHELIQNVEFIHGDYETSLTVASANTFFYLDPPYEKINKDSFQAYTKEGFDFLRYLNFLKVLDEKGCKVLASNSCFPGYSDFLINYTNQELDVFRNINRTNCKEIFTLNYESNC